MSWQEKKENDRLSPAGWIAIVVLLGLLAWAIWYAVWAWQSMDGVSMSTGGWAFLIGGIIVALLLGGGLMALVFYSSRHNYDQ